METKQCKECHSDIPKSAKRCKNCSAKQPKHFWKNIWFWILLLFFGPWFLINSFTPDTPVWDNIEKSLAAADCAKNQVRNNLKSPSSAVFPEKMIAVPMEWNQDENQIDKGMKTPLKENKFEILSYVDSQNGFGAMIRKEFYCEIELFEIKSENYSCTAKCGFAD